MIIDSDMYPIHAQLLGSHPSTIVVDHVRTINTPTPAVRDPTELLHIDVQNISPRVSRSYRWIVRPEARILTPVTGSSCPGSPARAIIRGTDPGPPGDLLAANPFVFPNAHDVLRALHRGLTRSMVGSRGSAMQASTSVMVVAAHPTMSALPGNAHLFHDTRDRAPLAHPADHDAPAPGSETRQTVRQKKAPIGQ